MAKHINAGNVGRSDMFKVDPNEIIVDPEMRARWEVPGEDRVLEIADSMFDFGQQQPIICRCRPDDKKLVLEAGGTRLEAAKLIVANRDPNWRIEVKVMDHNEEDGFVSAIIENRIRNETSPMDDAVNVRALRERYGKEDQEVCDILHCKSTYLRQLETLLSMPKKVQKLVHQRKLSVAAMQLLVGLTGDALEEALSQNTGKGTIDTSHVRQTARNRGKRVARSLKDVRTTFTKFSESETVPDRGKQFIARFLEYVAGTIDEETFLNDLMNVIS